MFESIDFSRNAINGVIILFGLGASTIAGPLNVIAKISATVTSFFACCMEEKIANSVHKYAINGFNPKDHPFDIHWFPAIVYEFLLNFVPTIDTLAFDKEASHILSLGNQLQKNLFEKAQSFLTDDSKALPRLTFFLSTPVIIIAKVGQFALGLLAAALSLATFGGFGGYLKELNLFAMRNLKIDIVDTLCDGLRYTFNPERFKIETHKILKPMGNPEFDACST